MELNLIFICSYMNVTDVIDTIENEKSNFMILTSDKGLQELFSDLYTPKKVIKLPRLFENFSSFTHLLRDLILLPYYKKKILNICKQLNPKKIIFYYIGWNGFESWLIKNLSREVNVYHRPKVNMKLLESNNSFRLTIKTFFVSFIYGIKFKSASFYEYPIIAIDKSFLKLVCAQKYNFIFNPKHVRRFVNDRFQQANNVEVLLLVGGEYNLDQTEYETVMNNLYNVLTKYYDPIKIGIKNHPNFPMVKFEWQDKCVIFDSKIPANLLCYTSKIIIAYASSVLYEAADIGIRAISTAYIIPSTLDGQSDNTVQYLLDNSKSKKISFPQDIDEFDGLLTTQAKASV